MPRLVLIRHGQSAWNLENRFTGWWDVDLTAQESRKRRPAGELMAAQGPRLRPLLHQPADPGDQDPPPRARADGPAVASGREGLAAERAPLWRPHRAQQGGDGGPDTATSRCGSGAARSTSRRREMEPGQPLRSGRRPALCRDERAADREPQGHDRPGSALLGRKDRAGAEGRAARSDLRPRQFASRAGQASVRHSGRRDHGLEIPTGKPIVYELDDDLAATDRYYLHER